MDGYSVDFADSAPKDSYWDIAVQVTDTRTGATATAHQGVKVRLDATANCPRMKRWPAARRAPPRQPHQVRIVHSGAIHEI